jgi:hypothetical protein
MIQTPSDFNTTQRGGRRYPGENLARFRWHTGGPLRPLGAEEPCPVLFRDLGPVAMARFLRGELRRLAGPLSPIIYMRTEEYAEPYTDYEHIGRLLFLRPLELQPWHSGVPTIYVAPASALMDADSIVFVPGEVPLVEAARLASELPDAAAWCEVLGERAYAEARQTTLAQLELLNADLERTEEQAGPLRALLQSPEPHLRDLARKQMGRTGIDESDLCTAWHHLPRARRDAMREGLRSIGERVAL